MTDDLRKPSPVEPGEPRSRSAAVELVAAVDRYLAARPEIPAALVDDLRAMGGTPPGGVPTQRAHE